ncbi:MAG: lipopolysaccharide heptosyltransferase II [Gammaproteobacteria bacterium]|nr:lipopolysaccharide heptosyltransferase II [Gammaproteobacteria bacterium]
MSADAAAVLVVAPAWVGDMVMAQSLFITLKEQQPDRAIDVVAPPWSLPLLARMPQVRRGIVLNTAHGELALGERWRLGRSLRQRYQQAVVMPRSLKAALLPFFAGIAQRRGYLGEKRYLLLNDIIPLDKKRLKQTVQRYVALATPKGQQVMAAPATPYPALTVNAANQQRLWQTLQLNANVAPQKTIALLAGAEYGPSKQWSAAQYGEVAGRLIAQGYAVWLIGSNKDRSVADQINRCVAGQAVNLCGQTSLEDAVDLLAGVDAVVSNDSGLMHIAAAVGTPLVAIYGSTTPRYTPPLTNHAEVLHLGLPCGPCFKRQCPIYETPACLDNISVDRVEAALLRLLSKQCH